MACGSQCNSIQQHCKMAPDARASSDQESTSLLGNGHQMGTPLPRQHSLAQRLLRESPGACSLRSESSFSITFDSLDQHQGPLKQRIGDELLRQGSEQDLSRVALVLPWCCQQPHLGIM